MYTSIKSDTVESVSDLYLMGKKF